MLFHHAPGATHALHMRFASRERATAFRQHDLVQESFRTELQPIAADLVEVLFQVRHRQRSIRFLSDWEL